MTRPTIVLSQINIYPIKSCRGIPLQNAMLVDRGLQYDRRWMIVDDSRRHVTQREMPRLALVVVTIHNDHLSVTGPAMQELHVPLVQAADRPLTVTVWDDIVQATDAGPESAHWFSAFLGIPARLVSMPDSADRLVEAEGHTSRVSFADATPLLLISEASLDDLNTRLAEPLPMNRFRPNLVVKGCAPYGEDSWNELTIGGVTLYHAFDCGRCVTTTVNQMTGEKGKEPLATLAAYRERNGSVYFGQRLIHKGRGVLRVGDEVRIIG